MHHFRTVWSQAMDAPPDDTVPPAVTERPLPPGLGFRKPAEWPRVWPHRAAGSSQRDRPKSSPSVRRPHPPAAKPGRAVIHGALPDSVGGHRFGPLDTEASGRLLEGRMRVHILSPRTVRCAADWRIDAFVRERRQRVQSYNTRRPASGTSRPPGHGLTRTLPILGTRQSETAAKSGDSC